MTRVILPLLALAATGAEEASGPHLNQVGFRPDTAKRAIIVKDGVAVPWALLDDKGRTVAQGTATVFGPDAASGDTVQQIDFGAFRTPGTYRLKVDGRTSHVFTIAADVYRPLSHASLNFFYQQRAGVAIDARFAGGT